MVTIWTNSTNGFSYIRAWDQISHHIFKRHDYLSIILHHIDICHDLWIRVTWTHLTFEFETDSKVGQRDFQTWSLANCYMLQQLETSSYLASLKGMFLHVTHMMAIGNTISFPFSNIGNQTRREGSPMFLCTLWVEIQFLKDPRFLFFWWVFEILLSYLHTLCCMW